jgi:hypothetical protein
LIFNDLTWILSKTKQVSNLKRAFKLMQLHAQRRTRNGANH